MRVRDGWEGVGEGALRVGSHGQAAQERGDIGVRDEALRVRDAFEVQDQTGLGRVEGPCSCSVYHGQSVS